MIIEAIIKTTISLIAEPLWQEIVITGITARLKEELLRKKTAKAISESLNEALIEVPGFEADIEEYVLIDFLGSPSVLNEVRKVASWYEFPNMILLRDEWAKRSPKTSTGKIEILLNAFLNRLHKRLLEIPELRDVL